MVSDSLSSQNNAGYWLTYSPAIAKDTSLRLDYLQATKPTTRLLGQVAPVQASKSDDKTKQGYRLDRSY